MIKSIFKIMVYSLLSVICCSSAQAVAIDSLHSDTTRIKQPKQPVSWSLTGQVYSASLYFFTGSVDQSDPSFDALFIYDRKTWGGFIYESVDLINRNTGINYGMIGLHKYFKVGEKLLITPNLGVNLNQNYSVADKGSDFIFDLAVTYKFNKHFTISNDAFFQNLIITKDYNWTNRVKLTFRETDFYITALMWDRNRVFHNPGYLSAGLDFRYNVIKLSPKANLIAGASNIHVLQSDTPRRNGFMFSLGIDFGG